VLEAYGKGKSERKAQHRSSAPEPCSCGLGHAELAADLQKHHGLPPVEQLLRDLNEARKAVAYGDVTILWQCLAILLRQLKRVVEALSAVDRDDLAGHMRGLVRGQIGD